MNKDLHIIKRETRKKSGMREFFILILVYSYYNQSNSPNNEFSIPQTVLADYFDCTVLTIKRWFAKLRDLGYLTYAKRENAGKTIYYKNDKNEKIPYTIPKYKRIKCGNIDEIKFLNIYQLDQIGLNQYLIDHIELDVLNNIKDYKSTFSDFITFLKDRRAHKETIAKLKEVDNEKLTTTDKQLLEHAKKIDQKIKENQDYLYKKWWLDKIFPEFTCKYLSEGSMRLTHNICNTVNPEHLDKINENNYWRSSHARNDMFKTILHTTDIVEYDINGSIYRLTYNLFHDTFLSTDVDIYELIWNNCNFKIKWTDDNRNAYRNHFKTILMTIYMRPNVISYRSSQWEYIDKYYANYPRKYSKLSQKEKELYELYKIFIDDLSISIKDFQLRVKDSIQTTLNIPKFIGPNVFIQESNLHILIREHLLLKGIKCVNIYDGFYFVRNTISKSEFFNIYNQCLAELKYNLDHNIGSSWY